MREAFQSAAAFGAQNGVCAARKTSVSADQSWVRDSEGRDASVEAGAQAAVPSGKDWSSKERSATSVRVAGAVNHAGHAVAISKRVTFASQLSGIQVAASVGVTLGQISKSAGPE